ncbi:MAG: hypothetical protein JST43_12010 [Bacteroidetes bacterium]|nr:hypothetical protein [Bacteroidota bacterium]MBS1541367.1 hypothetical protein [Bacteroidota bacterium]
MNTNKKIAIGLGLAGGALLAAWLLTGDRKQKTKEFVAKGADRIKKAFKGKEEPESTDQDVHYV